MEKRFISELDFDDMVYVCDYDLNNDMYMSSLNPIIREEPIRSIILLKDGTVKYNTENSFTSLEEAQKFIIDKIFEKTYKSHYEFETLKFNWISKMEYLNEESNKKINVYELEVITPEINKFGKRLELKKDPETGNVKFVIE